MKYFNYISILLFASLAALMSCTQNENLGVEESSTESFKIFVKDNGFVTDSNTRAVENGYSTKFVDGDAIGIFAVRNGEIVTNINNVRCVMANGAWEMDTNIEYKESEFKAMSFYAYYPYNASFNSETDFVASKTLTDNDPFENYVKSWKVDAVQDQINYTKSDLMTSVGKAFGQRLKGEVSFVMQHRMALAVLQMPTMVYEFTNATVAIENYTLPTKAGLFKLNKEEARPYEQIIDSKTYYRFLINPEKEFTIEGTYIAGKDEIGYDHTARLSSGQAKLYKVKNPQPIKLPLSIGDFFCADGTIVSKSNAVPNNAIGIVIYAGNPQPSANSIKGVTEVNDALKRDYPNCTHGLVMALNNGQAEASIMGPENASYSDWVKNNADLNSLYVLCNTKNPDTDYPGYMGYNNTALLMMAHENIPTKYCTNSYNLMKNYQENVPGPITASPWYIPSNSELNLIATNMTAINASLSVANGTELVSTEENSKTGFYWSSTERNGNTQWVHSLEGGSYAIRRDLGSNTGYLRLILAF